MAPLALAVPQPAHAADAVQCDAQAQVFAAEPGGRLWRYPFTAPASPTGAFGARAAVGSGWQMFGRVLGGPGGRVYGIKAEGVFRYRWLGTAWEGPAQLIHTGFDQYATAAFRNKITIDEAGDIYLIDGNGKLLTYRYDEARETWTIFARLLDNGWDRYDLIVAGSAGVLYGRTPDGQFYRHRYDAASQRWILRDKRVGTGWNTFTKGIFSAGGDVLFGIRANGTMVHYRYREDTGNFAVTGHQVGTGWHTFTNVLAITNGCRLNVSYSPVKPSTPVQSFTPTNAVQAQPTGGQTLGTIEYAFTDNIGRLLHGRQDPDVISSVQWTALSGDEAFTGKPAVVSTAAGAVQVLGHNVVSNVWQRSQSAPASPAWKPWADLGGAMRSEPVVARLSDDTLAAFALDADGVVWVRPQDGTAGDLMAWRRLSGTGLTGTLVATAVADRGAALIAADAGGTPQFATYRDGAISPWTSLGGAGFTGTPAVVVMPGRRLRVFARDADGRIATQQQNDAGVFPGSWTTLGDVVVAGSPAAVLNPISGRIDVVARRADGTLHVTRETAQGSGQWGDWVQAPAEGFVAATDPTTVAYSNSTGPTYLFVARDSDNAQRVWFPSSGTLARDADTPMFVAGPRSTPPA